MKLEDTDILSKLRSMLMTYRTDIAERNNYIYRRDRILYDNGLFEGLDIPDGFDRTLFNPLRRAVDIHSAQLMGENFGIYSYYDKIDLGQFKPEQKDELEQAEMANKEKMTKAFGRKNAWEAIVRDNGGYAIFKDGARTASAYGGALYQVWGDEAEKKVRIQEIESLNNWYPVWSDNNFREREGDAYIYQIAEGMAYRRYGKFLTDQQIFVTSALGDPLLNYGGNASTNNIQAGNTVTGNQTQELMCNVVEYTGYMPEVRMVRGEIQSCKRGEETKINFTSVGDVIIKKITREDRMPRFYYLPNRRVTRRPYGESDIVEEAIQVAQTYIERMSSLITLADKTIFPMIMAKGFSQANIPKKTRRTMQVVPMKLDQTLEALNLPAPYGIEMQIINELTNNLLAYLGIPRVLFFDPESNPASNAALLTTMRPILDIVRDKQSHWEPILVAMATDSLEIAASFSKDVKDLLKDDGDKYFYVRWPSAMLKDDPTHQSMLINDLRAGTLSVDTYLERRGVIDVPEEIARIRDNMKDPIKAAILGSQLGMLAHFAIYDSMGIPPAGLNPPKITLRGDLTPQQEGNLAQTQGYNDGPFGASIGPQGREGQAANDNAINQGFINGNPFDGGMPSSITPGQAIQPGGAPGQAGPGMAGPGLAPVAPGVSGQSSVLTPQVNNPHTQPISMPGSGATTRTPVGHVKQTNQRRGK